MTRPLSIASLALVLLASTAVAQEARPAATPASPAAATAPVGTPAGTPAAAPAAAPRPAATATMPAQAPAGAVASPGAPAALVGNAGNGRLLTFTCEGCHGVPGYKNAYPNYHVPLIVGQSTGYLVNALTEYRNGTRKHPTMQAQAQSFSEQDIADIATFLSGVKK